MYERKKERTRECGVCGSTGVHAYVCVHVTVVVFVRAIECVCVRVRVHHTNTYLVHVTHTVKVAPFSTRHTDSQGCPIYRFLPEVWKLNYDLNYKN